MDRGSNSAAFRWIVASCMFFGSPAPAAVPVAAFGNLPSIEQVALSPDGSTLAVIQTVQDQRLLAITNINDFKLVSAARVGDVRIRSIEWADDEHLLLTTASNQMPFGLSGERTEWHLMAVYDLKTNKLRGLLDRVRTDTQTMNVVYGRPVIQHKD
jgi:hypothetical protein